MTDLETGAAELFDPLRPDLVQIAYRMLGSVANAEDVVQDAFPRWYAMDRSAVKSPPAFLRQVVTRLSLDVLKAACRTRELYVGPWLREPVHQTIFGPAPDLAAGDRGFSSATNERAATERGVRRVVLPRRGPKTPARRA